MRPEDLKRADQLFHAALEQPSDAREAFVAESSGGDHELRDHVLALLSANEAATGYFEGLADHIASTVEVELTARDQIRVGPYETRRVIGRGGMGTVYLAERADGQFDQQVALKVMRLGMDGDDDRRRFLAERQIVARLQHPGIARLLDGGVTGEGRPYFVMEYVEGETITDYARSAGLPIDKRIDLVIQVGEALRYAHRNLVVHRDVKPSNVLVTAGGAVKLLDFGIAKLLDDGGPQASGPVTRRGERALSLPYAAPEQIQGAPVTTSTDVYSLGVVLYELLTGVRPHAAGAASERDLEREILEREPEKPSARAADPRTRRRLEGDVDMMCLMALRKEPERRYRSMEQLVDDLRRHRRGLPVSARPDAVGYRLGKFVRRHAVGVSAIAVIGALTATLAIVSTVQSARTARERDKAQQVAELLTRIFEVADPSEARGASVTALEILDRGVARVRSGLGEQPELKATLLGVMGRVYQNLGAYSRASPLIEESLALRKSSLGPSHRDVAEGMSALGEVLRLRGDYKGAEPLLREALEAGTRVNGPDSPETARTLNNLSKLLTARGKFDEADALARRSLAINRSRLGAEHAETGESLTNLGAALFSKGNAREAEGHFREALAIRRKALGAEHPLVPAALNNLATVLTASGDLSSAEAAHRDALAIYRHILGPEHPRVATSLNNLALVLFQRGDAAGAEPLMREALAMRRTLLDPAHAETAQSLANLGLLLQRTKRYGEAEVMYREALSIRTKAFGDKHFLVAQTLHNLGLLQQAQGDFAGAEALFRKATDLLRAQFGGAHYLVGTGLHDLAALLAARKDLAGAEPLYRQALDIRQKALPPAHPDTALTRLGLGELLAAQGKLAEAEPLVSAADDVLKAIPNPDREVLARIDRAQRVLSQVKK